MLFSLWISSLIITLMSFVVTALWYAYPGVPYASIGSIDDYPPSQGPYWVEINDEQYIWVVNTGKELIMFNRRTPHVWGCMYKWVTSNKRFEDPCSGAKFSLMGTLIDGPGMRSLDRYAYRIVGGKIQVETWRILEGAPRSEDTSLLRWEKHVDMKPGLNLK